MNKKRNINNIIGMKNGEFTNKLIEILNAIFESEESGIRFSVTMDLAPGHYYAEFRCSDENDKSKDPFNITRIKMEPGERDFVSSDEALDSLYGHLNAAILRIIMFARDAEFPESSDKSIIRTASMRSIFDIVRKRLSTNLNQPEVY